MLNTFSGTSKSSPTYTKFEKTGSTNQLKKDSDEIKINNDNTTKTLKVEHNNLSNDKTYNKNYFVTQHDNFFTKLKNPDR